MTIFPLRRRMRLWAICCLGVLLSGGTIAYLRHLTVRRTEAVTYLNALAAEAIARARDAGAMRWAPTELAEADSAYRDAYQYQLVEQGRRFLVPDFTAASVEFTRARSAAERAAVAASSDLAAARRDAASETELAADLVALNESLTAGVQLGTAKRRLLGQARTLLEDARIAIAGGDYVAARVSARESRSLALEVSEHVSAMVARYADPATVAAWIRMKRDAIERSRRDGGPAIVVSKQARTLSLYVGGHMVRTYPVEFGFNWIADKLVAGDGATPEGTYRVTVRKDSGQTRYHKALLIDYPNAEDRRDFETAVRTGRVARSAGIGGLIEIHGNGGEGRDWTDGCVALTNADMDDLFTRIAVGTPVTIIGSDHPVSLEDLVIGRNPSSR